MTSLSARQRFRLRLLGVFLAVMILAYARQLITSPTAGQDFRVFFAAATLVAHGQDPYDWPSLAHTEYALYNAPAHLTPDSKAYYEFLAYPEGPWLAYALVPLTALPWQYAFAIFVLTIGLIITVSAWAMFRALRWSPSLARVAAAAVLLSPIGFINLFMGQVGGLIFGAFVLSWTVLKRWPLLAGLVLTTVWIKPNIGLELPVVAALLEPRAALRMLGGFALGTAVAFAAALVTMGSAFFEWPMQVPRMWAAVQGAQPDIASIESFFYPGLSGRLKTIALVATLLVACAYGGWLLRRSAGHRSRALSLLLVWMCALPFVQSYDMILLAPVVAVLLGPDLRGWSQRFTEVVIWAFAIFPLCYFLGFRIGFFNGFTAIPVTLLLIAWHRTLLRTQTPQTLASHEPRGSRGPAGPQVAA